jgi:hypothetical protein
MQLTRANRSLRMRRHLARWLWNRRHRRLPPPKDLVLKKFFQRLYQGRMPPPKVAELKNKSKDCTRKKYRLMFSVSTESHSYASARGSLFRLPLRRGRSAGFRGKARLSTDNRTAGSQIPIWELDRWGRPKLRPAK